jgi:23S rRNA (uracil1939-C5)-methyltransferase
MISPFTKKENRLCYTLAMNPIILTTEKLAPGGDCMAKLDGKIVFVPDALPGEELEVTIGEEKKDYLTARIARILTPSPRRTEPRCPLYGQCGGCNLQMTDYPYQIELKTAILREAFRRAGCPQPLPEIRVVTGSPWEYRSRFQFRRTRQGAALKARRNDALIPVKDCPVAVPAIRTMLAGGTIPGRCGERFTLFAPPEDPQGPVVFETPGQNLCQAELAGKTFQFDVKGFFQSNLPLMEKMIAALCQGLRGNKALDLYSGSGVFARFLSDSFGQVTLVEQNAQSLAWAEVNLRDRPHVSYAQSGKAWLGGAGAKERFDAIAADPPRSGLESQVLAWLCGEQYAPFRYVSCNPVTLARDAAVLVHAGYALEDICLFDFYPQTSHIEALACFTRAHKGA